MDNRPVYIIYCYACIICSFALSWFALSNNAYRNNVHEQTLHKFRKGVRQRCDSRQLHKKCLNTTIATVASLGIICLCSVDSWGSSPTSSRRSVLSPFFAAFHKLPMLLYRSRYIMRDFTTRYIWEQLFLFLWMKIMLGHKHNFSPIFFILKNRGAREIF